MYELYLILSRVQYFARATDFSLYPEIYLQIKHFAFVKNITQMQYQTRGSKEPASLILVYVHIKQRSLSKIVNEKILHD